jgi:hypothetical protein
MSDHDKAARIILTCGYPYPGCTASWRDVVLILIDDAPVLGNGFLPLVEQRIVPEHSSDGRPRILLGRVDLQGYENRSGDHSVPDGLAKPSQSLFWGRTLSRNLEGRATCRPESVICNWLDQDRNFHDKPEQVDGSPSEAGSRTHREPSHHTTGGHVGESKIPTTQPGGFVSVGCVAAGAAPLLVPRGVDSGRLHL